MYISFHYFKSFNTCTYIIYTTFYFIILRTVSYNVLLILMTHNSTQTSVVTKYLSSIIYPPISFDKLSCYRDPQLQVGKNDLYLNNLNQKMCESCNLMPIFGQTEMLNGYDYRRD